MSRSRSPLRPFILAGAAVVLALALSGCGRKGALDPPPGGYELDPLVVRTPVTRRAGAPQETQYDEEGRPIAPQGRNRRLPADWLID